MAFNRNPLDSFAGIGQFGADQLAWNPQYSVSGRKAAPELSPGARKNIGLIGMQAKQKKSNFYLDDEDSEASMYFNNQSIFQPQKEMITSPSPSQLSAFSSNLYSQSSGFGNIAIQQRNMNSQQFQRPSSSIPGHVTPTSGGMVPNFPSSLPQQQQASPNRNMLPLSSRGVLGQPQLSQSISNLKRNVGIPSSLVTSSNQLSGMSQFGLSQNRGFSGSQGIVGSGADNSSVTLDPLEFPSLTNRGRHDNTSSSSALGTNPMAGKTAYVGMVKQPNSESSQEFQIHNEDFPALPGSQNQDSSREDASRKTPVSSVFATGGTKQQLQKPGIQTAADGMVTNIPAGMVTDQFGMVGLLTFIRATETDPNLVSLALGSDLTTLGLNLNSPENLYPNFGGPWAETPCRPQDIDFHVPQEYLTNMKIRDGLAPIKLNRYGEDLLFYMFYTNGGDVLQLAAAAELYNRDWRYHKEERVWITRSPGMVPVEKTNTYERGTYFFFDAQNWRKVAKEFHLDYDKLEDRPHLPPSLLPSPAQGAIMA